MSNLTLDEAIKHCEEVAEKNEISAITYKNCKKIKTNMYEKLTAEKAENDCRECAADHRQLAEWLTELKELRSSLGTVKLSNMKEARELIRDYKAENITQKKLIAEYKRLLKAAVQDIRHCMHYYDPCEVCSLLGEDGECPTTDDDDCKEKYKWCYEDEALALIGEEGENDA